MADLKIYIQSIICMHEYLIRNANNMLKILLYHKKFKTVIGCVAMTMGKPGDHTAIYKPVYQPVDRSQDSSSLILTIYANMGNYCKRFNN